MAKSLSLSGCHVRTSRSITNRLHFFIHGIALLFLFRYRVTSLTQIINSQDHSAPILPHVLIFIAEAIFAFIWILSQPSKWRPVVRTPYPERLPGDDSLPAIDVFICTADPNKEPTLEVMNTVISAMALDYPPDKLHVYVSDDGGSSVTLRAAKQAWDFAKFWIPFCRKHEVKNRCPQAYFLEEDDGHGKVYSGDFKEVQRRYKEFKSQVSEIVGKTGVPASKDHPAVLKVIGVANKEDQMPFLAYVAREKRPSHPHHFKAGALNVLFRVSAMITNSPYVLVIDCDMYCSDSSSARQAMCFHLDPKLSPKLGFVQFPQIFYNIAQKDIYDGRLRYIWEKWEGFDGILGPILSGTGFYLKREAIYGTNKFQDDDDVDLVKLNKCFGSSNEFIRSMHRNYKPKYPKNVVKSLDDSLQNEIQFLASCSYDKGTKWGTEVGFRYFSVVEDYFTSMNLHCEGWTSVYVEPSRPCFLGTSPISLGEHLFQYSRWYAGLIQICLSRFNPLLYGPLRMSLWQSMCYAEFAHSGLYFVAFYVMAIVPQFCLLRSIPLYPKVSSPYFGLFWFIFFSSQLKHVQEVLSTGHSIRVWLIEQRIWMINSWIPYLYATVDVVQEKFGMRAISFLPTNKVVDDELEKRYQSGIYDFQAAPVFMVPLCSLYMLNVATFVLGFGRILEGKGDMLLQGFIPLFGMALHFPFFEGMALRKDKGRVAPSVCLTSALVCGSILSFGLSI